MSKVAQKQYSRHNPIEDTMSPAAWRAYCRRGIAGKPYRDDVRIRTRWLIMMVRRVILAGSRLTVQAMLNDLAQEGHTDLQFSDTPPVNKAKLRVGKYTIQWCLRHLRSEMATFIDDGTVLRHKKHLTQDVSWW